MTGPFTASEAAPSLPVARALGSSPDATSSLSNRLRHRSRSRDRLSSSRERLSSSRERLSSSRACLSSSWDCLSRSRVRLSRSRLTRSRPASLASASSSSSSGSSSRLASRRRPGRSRWRSFSRARSSIRSCEKSSSGISMPCRSHSISGSSLGGCGRGRGGGVVARSAASRTMLPIIVRPPPNPRWPGATSGP